MNGVSLANTCKFISIAAGTTNFIVQGCVLGGTLGLGGTMSKGLVVGAGASDRYIIADNLITGTGGGITDGGTGVNKRVANNY